MTKRKNKKNTDLVQAVEKAVRRGAVKGEIVNTKAPSPDSELERKRKEKEDLDSMDDMMQSMLMLVMMIVIISLVPFIANAMFQASNPAVPTTSEDYLTTAEHVGMFYYKLTPETHPNELRMVGENSTGAFEHLLVSKST